MNSLERLIPPPEHPTYNGRASDWPLIERILEMELPADFKRLINSYGTGCFLNFIYPLSPFAPFDTSLNLLSGSTSQILSAYESGRKEFPQYSPPFPAYPAQCGLFPWATTSNGDTFFWLRTGKSDQWPTIICDSKFSEEYDRFELNATETLYCLFSGQSVADVFPDNLLTMPIAFTPYRKTFSKNC